MHRPQVFVNKCLRDKSSGLEKSLIHSYADESNTNLERNLPVKVALDWTYAEKAGQSSFQTGFHVAG